ncbi:hypothetical protein PGT21_020816 [Puccinia graminis f. sp. tritici]|uniref:Prefoldin subunit 4 n=1 Tax=Puccinia graminis f. sp. tritici TaxID=56615 RepID=A0A5B0LMA0_PUCGR|nr:hypothetical protein PGT21_020816 [Puccinia graminis f. sp. tritici]KAA1130276.1 hypothetical protein PGTUg99_003181 [Puccinia graminis f. sp. tritici]
MCSGGSRYRGPDRVPSWSGTESEDGFRSPLGSLPSNWRQEGQADTKDTDKNLISPKPTRNRHRMEMLEPIRATSGKDSSSKIDRNDEHEPAGMEEIEVNFKDQKMINQFSNLNLKKIKLKKLIKSKSVELDDLIELENELLLSSFDDIDQSNNNENLDDESGPKTTEDNDLILYKLDSSYIHIKRSTFQETKLPESLDRSREMISKLNSDLTDLNTQMSELKKTLYSKFGNTINLEGGDEDEDEEVVV